jgi:hypothetical protein
MQVRFRHVTLARAQTDTLAGPRWMVKTNNSRRVPSLQVPS